MTQSHNHSIAVYRVHPATLWVAVFAALLLQTFLPRIVPLARLFDFPLLVTLYFALVRRNKVFGTLLGTGTGLTQDALAHGLVGMFGMSKALVGYLAAWASVKFDLEQIVARFVLAGILVLAHSLILLALEHALLEAPPPLEPLDLASTVLVNVALALILFPVLDRFKRPV